MEGLSLSPGRRVRASVKRGIVRDGSYWRADDSRRVRRFRCLKCRRTFSSSRWSACFRQKKRRVNPWVAQLLGNTVSLRATARILGLNRKTVVRKSLFLGALAKAERLKRLAELTESAEKITEIQFDEMESFERTKCLPLSIPIVVEARTRKVLGFRVAVMPAKGPLAAISRKKYGPRKDERAKRASELFAELVPVVSPDAIITTDQKSAYPRWLRKHFPKAKHRTIKGKRGCGTGQGELKRVVFDPLFSFNHTAAMFRANINRLIRRTWCTTKRADRLAGHIELYIQAHNRRIDELRARGRD